MINLRTNSVILFALLCAGCANNEEVAENSQPTTIAIDLNRELQSIHATDLIKEVTIIHLADQNATSHALIGEVNEIITYEDLIYLLDLKNEQSVFIYDKSGNFINRISAEGKAPNEYVQLVDILINPDDRTLNLISGIDKKMLVYDLDGNDLNGIKNLPKSFRRLSKTEEGFVGFMGNVSDASGHSKNVWLLGEELGAETGYFEIDPGFESYYRSAISPFSTFNDRLYYIQMLDYNIYTVDKDTVHIAYTFDFGTKSWPSDINSLTKIDAMPIIEKMGYVQDFYDFQETDSYLISEILLNGQKVLGLLDKRNNESFGVTLDPYEDKYFFSFGQIVGMDEDAIYTLIDAMFIKRILAGKDDYNDFESKYPEQIKRLRELFDGLDIRDDSNPFLVTYYLR